MTFIALGVVLALWLVGKPLTVDTTALLLAVALGVDMICYRIKRLEEPPPEAKP